MALTEEQRKKIDALSLEEVRDEVLLDNRSHYQGEKFDYLLVRLAQLQEQKRDDQRAEDAGSEREKIDVAKEANQIAKAANNHSKIAIWVAALALLVSLFNFAHDVSQERMESDGAGSATVARSPNESFKPFATLTRTPSTSHLIAHGFAIVAQKALRTGRRLTRR